jgi:nucleotidyltransferase/DNA polymerase involved in DNA repair
MIIREIRVENVTLNAEYAGKQWTDTIEEMKIRGIGKKHSVNTRALGIMIVRKLAKKTTRSAAKKQLQNVTEAQIEELGSKLLESLLNKN